MNYTINTICNTIEFKEWLPSQRETKLLKEWDKMIQKSRPLIHLSSQLGVYYCLRDTAKNEVNLSTYPAWQLLGKMIIFLHKMLVYNNRKNICKNVVGMMTCTLRETLTQSLLGFKWNCCNSWEKGSLLNLVVGLDRVSIRVTITGIRTPWVMSCCSQTNVSQVRIRVVFGRESLFSGTSMRQEFPFLWVSPLHPSVLKPNLHLKRRKEGIRHTWGKLKHFQFYLRIFESEFFSQFFSIWLWNVLLNLESLFESLSLSIWEDCSSHHASPWFSSSRWHPCQGW